MTKEQIEYYCQKEWKRIDKALPKGINFILVMNDKTDTCVGASVCCSNHGKAMLVDALRDIPDEEDAISEQ
jgi:hypothetical protein